VKDASVVPMTTPATEIVAVVRPPPRSWPTPSADTGRHTGDGFATAATVAALDSAACAVTAPVEKADAAAITTARTKIRVLDIRASLP
jgi:hypothetical protein